MSAWLSIRRRTISLKVKCCQLSGSVFGWFILKLAETEKTPFSEKFKANVYIFCIATIYPLLAVHVKQNEGKIKPPSELHEVKKWQLLFFYGRTKNSNSYVPLPYITYLIDSCPNFLISRIFLVSET